MDGGLDTLVEYLMQSIPHCATQLHINKLLRNAVDRQWCKKHGKILPPPKLPRVVLVSVFFSFADALLVAMYTPSCPHLARQLPPH